MEVSSPLQRHPRQDRAFTLVRRATLRVMQRRLRMYRLLRSAYAKMTRNRESVAQVGDDLGTLLRLAHRWIRKEYRSIPWRSMFYGVAAIVYFVNPVDLVPDMLVGLGFVDDVAVIGAVVHALRKDLQRFKQWEYQFAEPSDRRLVME